VILEHRTGAGRSVEFSACGRVEAALRSPTPKAGPANSAQPEKRVHSANIAESFSGISRRIAHLGNSAI